MSEEGLPAGGAGGGTPVEGGGDTVILPPPEDGVIRPIANATVLVLSPKAHAKAGIGGQAIARPLSVAVLARKEDRVIYLPEVSAVAGPGGTAVALPELVIRKLWEEEEEKRPSRLEHRGAEDAVQKVAGDGEVVEASEFVSVNAGEKSVAQAQPTGIATAGQGGVAVSSPQGVAVVGPGGLAIARPVAIAVAGPGADKPGIFLRPEGVGQPGGGEEGATSEEPPEVEEASEEGGGGGPSTPLPPAVFHYMLYPRPIPLAPPQYYPALV